MSLITASGLSVRYGERVALERSDFSIPAGARTAVIGPNGSGKSTLLSAVAGLVEPASGTVTVLGLTPHEASSRVAYVLQSAKLNEALPVTVREVVAMGRYSSLGAFRVFGRTDREAVDSALDRLSLTSLANRHLSELSGGQRQRVFIAQGLVQEHSVLLLDEPSTGLDLVSEAAIESALEEERGDGCAVVVTTHDLEEALTADHVILLAGRVVACGPPAEVLTASNLSEAYRSRILEVEGRLLLDDSAHRPAGEAHHVHLERGSTDL
ncbi:MAG: zinc ABC transporter ATP-binding protein AztA [Acidimicrobiia bacterium]|nr:zinc ABC transporter ATP-binding protein AztA [Acidimicrobiia bacterium]